MAPHKYTVGQTVEYRPQAGDMPGARGSYTITRALPGDDHDRTYRARGARDGQERVLRESQLSPVRDAVFGWDGARPNASAPNEHATNQG